MDPRLRNLSRCDEWTEHGIRSKLRKDYQPTIAAERERVSYPINYVEG